MMSVSLLRISCGSLKRHIVWNTVCPVQVPTLINAPWPRTQEREDELKTFTESTFESVECLDIVGTGHVGTTGSSGQNCELP